MVPGAGNGQPASGVPKTPSGLTVLRSGFFAKGAQACSQPLCPFPLGVRPSPLGVRSLGPCTQHYPLWIAPSKPGGMHAFKFTVPQRQGQPDVLKPVRRQYIHKVAPTHT